MLISLEAGCFGQKCTLPIGQNRPFVPALKCDLLGLAEPNRVFVPALKCDILGLAEPNRLFVPAVNCDLLNRPESSVSATGDGDIYGKNCPSCFCCEIRLLRVLRCFSRLNVRICCIDNIRSNDNIYSEMVLLTFATCNFVRIDLRIIF